MKAGQTTITENISCVLALALVRPRATGTATADVALFISVDLGTNGAVHAQNYACGDGETFAVQYVNTHENTLAIVPLNGRDRILISVVSASGAKCRGRPCVMHQRGHRDTGKYAG